MGWKDNVGREFVEADREFVEKVLPVGAVDRAAFGLIADATRYLLVEEKGEVHLRGETAALGEVLRSLAQGGLLVTANDAHAAVARFAALWEEKARLRGTWDRAVDQARRDGAIAPTPRPEPKRSFWDRLRGRSTPR